MEYTKRFLRRGLLSRLFVVLGFAAVIIATLVIPFTPSRAGANNAGAKAQASPTPDPCLPTQSGSPPPRRLCGEWGELVNLKTVPVHISLLPNEQILYWGRDKQADHITNGDHWDMGDRSHTYLWNPLDLTGGINTPPLTNTTTNLFCSGHSFLPDGRLLVTGGHSRHLDPARFAQEGIGETDVNIFDYRTNTWSLVPGPGGLSMPVGRWYPSNVTLSTGETLISAGFQGSRSGAPNVGLNPQTDLFTANGQIRQYQDPNVTGFELYPFLFLKPNGHVLFAGPGPSPSWNFDPSGTVGTFTEGPGFEYQHNNGSAAMYEPGKILMVGGFTPLDPFRTAAHTIDLKGNSTWTEVASMHSNRSYPTATVLPDGKVLVTGGTKCTGGPRIDCLMNGQTPVGAATRPEMWDPVTNKWTFLARSLARPNYPDGIPRSYHSIALLLPDARVLVGGGGLPAAGGEVVGTTKCVDRDNSKPECLKFGHKDVEFYSPPYLFDANGNPASRPGITSAPNTLIYGQTFNVSFSSTAPITSVVLIRLPSVTHTVNFDQRRVVLNSVPTSSTSLSVTAPPDPKDCPPGPYMLFLLSNGVPSKAKIVTVPPFQPPRFEGQIEAINCDQIRGWAWDNTLPNTPIDVTISFANTNGGPVVPPVTVTANVFRQDLLNAGKGNGFHGFVYNIPASMRDGRTRIVNATFTGTNTALQRNIVGSLMCPASLFPTQLPTGTAGGEGQTWEQATQFSTSVSDVMITHVAFYKAAGETGSHFGRIWTDTGVPLTPPIQFTNETPGPGWQVQALPSPLFISPNVKYRVSYNINSVVAKTFAGLATPIIGPLSTAHTSFYSTPAGTFPTINSGSILFADVRLARSVAVR